MAGALNNPAAVRTTLMHGGMSSNQALSQLDNMTQSQAIMLSTDQMFMAMAVLFVIAAGVVWLAPKPKLNMGGPPASGH
jgi:DHA2 family multidrug resistance protein